MNERTVSSVAQFQAFLEQLAKATKVYQSTMQLWFRGQGKCSWPLLPGLYRENALVAPRFERQVLREFRAKAGSYLGAQPSFERALFLMQHYGLPTRLIDWTTNSLVALFFAVEQQQAEDACVWVLSPWRLNQITRRSKTIPTEASTAFQSYSLNSETQERPEAELPMAVASSHSDIRIHAQDATFTVHGFDRRPLEEIKAGNGASALLAKLIIPRSRCRLIKRELFGIGFHRGHLFPDLNGLSAEIAYRYSAEYFAPDISLTPVTRAEIVESVASTNAINAQQLRDMMMSARPSFTTPDIPMIAPAATETASSEAVSSPDKLSRQIAQSLILTIRTEHAQQIELGKKHGDLHYRLRNEIEKARTDYLDRVSPSDTLGQDFNEELIRILADGDAGLLRL